MDLDVGALQELPLGEPELGNYCCFLWSVLTCFGCTITK